MAFDLLQFQPQIQADLESSLIKTLQSNYWSTGPCEKQLEERFSRIYARECVATSSGGSALQLVNYLYPHIKRIAIQSNTYFATALPWINSKVDILLMASSRKLLMPDSSIVQMAVDEKVDAIVLTHIGGFPNPFIKEIAKTCSENNILLIEDCAHSPLVSIDSNLVGTFGDVAILSFYPTKPIPAGEGGLLILKDSNLAEEARKIRNYGKSLSGSSTLHSLPAAPNLRMNEFAASIVNTILTHYDNIRESRSVVASHYDNYLKSKTWEASLQEQPVSIEPSFYKYICFDIKASICTSPVYDYDNQLTSILASNKYPFRLLGDPEYLIPHTCLPLAPSMTLNDVNQVMDCLS